MVTRGRQHVVVPPGRGSALRVCASIATMLLALAVALPRASAGPSEDAYTAGYVTAILERQMDVKGSKVSVKDGIVTVELAGLPAQDRDRLVASLRTVPGVVQVVVVERAEPPATAPPATAPLPTTAATPSGAAVEAEVPRRGVEVLPKGLLFAPLIADPRWPHFSAAYQRFIDDPRLQDAANVTLGETFSLVRGPVGASGAWELGIQAGVFSIFDLDAPSGDLVNADYMVGLPVAYRLGDFSALARLFHQSSHLGDEFLLANKVQRINLSYETVDLRLSYEVTKWLRVYGGGGYMVRRDPSDLEPWSAQAGFELRSPWTFLGGALRPLAALDVQTRQQNDWRPDFSARAGVQFEKLPLYDRKIQLLLEYFDGYSPNGQFFQDKVQYIGLGLHFYLY